MSTPPVTREELAKMVDHSLLKPAMTHEETIKGIEVAIKYNVAAASIKPCYVKLAAERLAGTTVKVNPVISFPFGFEPTEVKVAAAKRAVADGADEIDMVLNLGALFGDEYEYVRDDLAAVVEAAPGKVIKVILETGIYKEMSLIETACRLVEDAGAHFVKTSTGFADSPYRNERGETVGYTIEIIKLMRASVSDRVEVKAAQGVRRLQDALDVIELGVTRFGVSQTETLMNEYAAAYG